MAASATRRPPPAGRYDQGSDWRIGAAPPARTGRRRGKPGNAPPPACRRSSPARRNGRLCSRPPTRSCRTRPAARSRRRRNGGRSATTACGARTASRPSRPARRHRPTAAVLLPRRVSRIGIVPPSPWRGRGGPGAPRHRVCRRRWAPAPYDRPPSSGTRPPRQSSPAGSGPGAPPISSTRWRRIFPVAEEVVETGDDGRCAARLSAMGQGAGNDLRHPWRGRVEVWRGRGDVVATLGDGHRHEIGGGCGDGVEHGGCSGPNRRHRTDDPERHIVVRLALCHRVEAVLGAHLSFGPVAHEGHPADQRRPTESIQVIRVDAEVCPSEGADAQVRDRCGREIARTVAPARDGRGRAWPSTTVPPRASVMGSVGRANGPSRVA